MSSGVTVTQEAKTIYDEVKKDKKYRYIIYHIKDEREIDVESTGPRDAKYSDLLEKLQKLNTECRYCLFDFPVNVPTEGSDMSVDRLVLMTWCPDDSKVKQKMLYSSSFEALKKALVGVYKFVQACDFEDISEKTIADAFKKGSR